MRLLLFAWMTRNERELKRLRWKSKIERRDKRKKNEFVSCINENNGITKEGDK